MFRVPIDVCATACYKAITHFWDARSDCVVDNIIICLTANNFDAFFNAFREESFYNENSPKPVLSESGSTEEKIGYIELDEDDLNESDDEISDWFK